MEIIIKAIVVTIIIGICLFIIKEGINIQLKQELNRQKELNKNLCYYRQMEINALYMVLKHIKLYLLTLNSSEYLKDDQKNTVTDIIRWIEQLEKINNGENNGIHK